MANLIVGVFDEYPNAEAAREELLAAGVQPNHIRLSQRESPRHVEHEDDHNAFWDNIRDYFGIEEDEKNTEGDGLIAGGVLTVVAHQQTFRTIIDIMTQHEPAQMNNPWQQQTVEQGADEALSAMPAEPPPLHEPENEDLTGTKSRPPRS